MKVLQPLDQCVDSFFFSICLNFLTLSSILSCKIGKTNNQQYFSDVFTQTIKEIPCHLLSVGKKIFQTALRLTQVETMVFFVAVWITLFRRRILAKTRFFLLLEGFGCWLGMTD